jgi:hypothetical protein
VASYRVEVKSGKKGTCVEHSRYDARIGQKYSDKEDLLAFEFGNMPDWCTDHPLSFWKHADRHERKNAAAYREWIISLPNEFDHEQNTMLGRKVAKAVAGIRPWQMALHGPEGELSGSPNPHIHVMISDRAPDGVCRPPKQYFSRYNPAHPERGGCRKLSGGKTRQQMRDDLITTREEIAALQNEALAEAGMDVRVDHRSLREQGIDRAPGFHLGPARIKKMTTEERREHAASKQKNRLVDGESPAL